jgi:hypothetical protein
MDSVPSPAPKQAPAFPAPPEPWKEGVLLRHCVRALAWLLGAYLAASMVHTAMALRQYVSGTVGFGDEFEREGNFAFAFVSIRDYLAYLVPLLFVAFWLSEASGELRKCTSREGWHGLPSALALLRRAFIVLSVGVWIYLAWYMYAVE